MRVFVLVRIDIPIFKIVIINAKFFLKMLCQFFWCTCEITSVCNRFYYFLSHIHSAALKLYTGFIMSTMLTVSSMHSMISSIGLYAIGASSMVSRQTEVVKIPFMDCS